MAEYEDLVQYNVFGSKSSLDVDIMLPVFEKFERPDVGFAECKKYEALLRKQYGSVNSKREAKYNINLCIVEDGLIVWTLKGSADETNNSLFLTYKNHEQMYPCFVTQIATRNIPIKIVRAVRVILSMFTKTDIRAEVKGALKQDVLYARINALKKIDMMKLKIDSIDSDNFKCIAFQIAQTSALINGLEIYSKEEAITYMPQLEPFISRKGISEDELMCMTKEIRTFCELIEIQYAYIKDLENMTEILYTKKK